MQLPAVSGCGRYVGLHGKVNTEDAGPACHSRTEGWPVGKHTVLLWACCTKLVEAVPSALVHVSRGCSNPRLGNQGVHAARRQFHGKLTRWLACSLTHLSVASVAYCWCCRQAGDVKNQ